MKPIPYGRQSIDDQDIEAVVQVLRSDFLTSGPVIPRFENAIRDYCGAKYAVAVSNATSGLHLACLALDLKKGDRVWTSPNTFVASANCALYCGAEIDFVDIDPGTYNLSVTELEKKLQAAKKAGTLPTALVAVHFGGQSCDMRRIHELSKTYGFKIIEDASHAIGGSYLGKPVGSCEFSDIAVFSLHPVKIITTGEGGLLLTNQVELHEKMSRLRSHGITRDPKLMSHAPDGPWYYEQLDLGYNFRMTDIQAALGLSQMRRLKEFIARRTALADRYRKLLAGMAVEVPVETPDAKSAHHLFVIRLKTSALKKTHLQVFEDLQRQGILVNIHYIPVYLQPYYQKLGFKRGECPQAEKYYAEAITLPLFPAMSDADQDRVVSALKEAIGK